MMVTRRVPDALAAASCGLGVVFIATGLKPIPSVIGYLGFLAFAWGILLILGCLGAAVGSLLRTRRTDQEAFTRRLWSVTLERICWPAIAFSAVAFAFGVAYRLGPISGATTIGWTGFVIFTCIGHWLVIKRAVKDGAR